jgi:hypothetical protein
MHFLTQRQQILFRPKILIQFRQIINPISRIIRPIVRHARYPCGNGTYPEGGKAHSLDVVELVLETSPGSATVAAEGDVAGSGGAVGGEGETVDHDLVDGASSPEVGRGS